MFYDCPICGTTIPVKSGTKQGYGMVRSNHLRSHGINTSFLTLEQKNSRDYIKKLYHWLRMRGQAK